MRIPEHFCRGRRFVQKRMIWLALVIFGDDLIVILILAVYHYLHAGGGAGM